LLLVRALSAGAVDPDRPHFDRVLNKPVKPATFLRALAELTHQSATPVAGAAAELAGSELPTGLRVLLAEDNPVNQRVTSHLLRKLGTQVYCVANGLEVVQALRESDFDLVLMDCQMPEMDGYTATTVIRDASSGVKNPAIPVIALTAHALATDREKCLQAGMNDYLAKPIDPVGLQHALLRAAGKTAAAPQAAPAAHAATRLFDPPTLLARAGDDPEFARELIALFAQSVADDMRELRSAVEAGDEVQTRRLAHAIKGSAANLAAEALAAEAAALEKAAGSDAARAAHARLESILDATLAEWRRGGWLAAARGAAAKFG
jgi:CheY-like chemotaxis protein/HPt (histidine-containing phosphotransfer) domain-containing protein